MVRGWPQRFRGACFSSELLEIRAAANYIEYKSAKADGSPRWQASALEAALQGERRLC
jgi:hypothetical protein